MKKQILLFSALLFGVFALAQQMQPATVSNGGGNMNINEVKAGFTIGQPVTGAIANGTIKFTQGFQQNWLTEPDAINEKDKLAIEVLVSPKPSHSSFNIKIENSNEAVNWKLINIHGRLLASGDKQSNDFTIDLSSYSKGIYYLKISQDELLFVEKLVLQ